MIFKRFHFVNDIGISAVNYDIVVDYILNTSFSRPEYVCFTDLYTATLAFKDTKLKEILNNSNLTLPDGKPLEWIAKSRGFKSVETVSGYWLLLALLKSKKSHYFYGSNAKALDRIKAKIEMDYPTANVLGYKSPPILNSFDAIENNSEIIQDIEHINLLKPDLVWIGISSPKQDYLMGTLCNRLDKGLMLGVGGVFDYFAGIQKKSPEWLKKIGFRWLYRLIRNPKRLWRKYFFTFLGMLGIIKHHLIRQIRITFLEN